MIFNLIIWYYKNWVGLYMSLYVTVKVTHYQNNNITAVILDTDELSYFNGSQLAKI